MPRISAAGDWWTRSQVLTGIAWQTLRSAPSIFWPLAAACLASVTGLYVAEGIASPLGLAGLVLGPGLGLWLVTMSVGAQAQVVFRTVAGNQAHLSFGRSLRMLLEHRKNLSHRITLWIVLGILGAGIAAILVSLITAAALFVPGTKLLLGLLLGFEVLLAAAILPLSILVGGGLALQPMKACRPGPKTSLREDLAWWRAGCEARDWLATGIFLSSLAAVVGILLGLAALDTVLELNALVIPAGMQEVLSASVLAPLLGIERAVEPSLTLQVAGVAASAGICGALAAFLTPAAALWSAASAAAALVTEPAPEAHTKD